MSITFGSLMVLIFNWLGSLLCVIPNYLGFSQKNILLFGVSINLLCFLLLMVLIHYEQSVLIVIVLTIYLLNLEMTIGPVKLIHMFETCVDNASGFAFSIWFMSMIASVSLS